MFRPVNDFKNFKTISYEDIVVYRHINYFTF